MKPYSPSKQIKRIGNPGHVASVPNNVILPICPLLNFTVGVGGEQPELQSKPCYPGLLLQNPHCNHDTFVVTGIRENYR